MVHVRPTAGARQVRRSVAGHPVAARRGARGGAVRARGMADSPAVAVSRSRPLCSANRSRNDLRVARRNRAHRTHQGHRSPTGPDVTGCLAHSRRPPQGRITNIRDPQPTEHLKNLFHDDRHGRLLALGHHDAASFVGATPCGTAPSVRRCRAGSSRQADRASSRNWFSWSDRQRLPGSGVREPSRARTQAVPRVDIWVRPRTPPGDVFAGAGTR